MRDSRRKGLESLFAESPIRRGPKEENYHRRMSMSLRTLSGVVQYLSTKVLTGENSNVFVISPPKTVLGTTSTMQLHGR